MREKVDDLESITQLRDIIADVNVAELSANIQQPIGTGREARVSPAWVDAWQRAADRVLEEIDRELADRYIELPVDMDGVPWHIGDVVDGHGVVRDMGLNRYGWSFFGMTAIDPAIHRHAKPRTLEDVLREFAQGVQGQNADFADLAAKKYAEEIRELIGGAE